MERAAGSARRMLKEIKALQEERGLTKDVFLWRPEEDNLHRWKAWIQGPADTPFQDAYFELIITVPDEYPLRPPSVSFLTKVFHPNVHYKTGEICLDLLKDAWTPAFTLQSVCRAIIMLLAHPEPDSPLNCDCGNLLRCGDERGYRSLARLYTHLHARFEEPILPPSH